MTLPTFLLSTAIHKTCGSRLCRMDVALPKPSTSLSRSLSAFPWAHGLMRHFCASICASNSANLGAARHSAEVDSGMGTIEAMVCEEKVRLIDKYAASTSALFAAVTQLRLKPGSQFRKALALSKAARAECV